MYEFGGRKEIVLIKFSVAMASSLFIITDFFRNCWGVEAGANTVKIGRYWIRNSISYLQAYCATHLHQQILSSRTSATPITRSHVLSCSSRLHCSSQVYVEKVELLAKLNPAYLKYNLDWVVFSLSLNLLANYA